MYNPSIANAFRFTEDDLSQNKTGQVSVRQKATTRRGGKIACIALVLLGVIIALGVYHVNKSKNDTALVRAAIVLSTFASIGLYFLFRALYIASRSAVKNVTGNIAIVFKRKVGKCLVIENSSFPVSGTPTENLFVTGKTYTVYYLGTSTLLSINEH